MLSTRTCTASFTTENLLTDVYGPEEILQDKTCKVIPLKRRHRGDANRKTGEKLTVRYESWKKPLACSYVHTFSMQTCSRVEPAVLRFCRWMSEFACCLSRNTARRESVRCLHHNRRKCRGECLACQSQLPSNQLGLKLLTDLPKC